jgi:hypothetical protein
MAEQNPDINRDDDALEAELASFRPQPMLLKTRVRIGAQLGRQPVRWFSATALAVAACVLIGFAVWLSNPPTTTVPGIPVPPSPSATVAGVGGPPTVFDYQRAFSKSSDALDALLARPAGREARRANHGDSETPRAFSRSINELTNSNGD